MNEPTVFDEIFALLTPARIFEDSRATGEGVSLAVIDSGVERSVLEDKFATASTPIYPIDGAVFRPSGPPQEYTGHQSSPHGTTVADIILTLAPLSTQESPPSFPTGGITFSPTLGGGLR